jgi:hypothetical protein
MRTAPLIFPICAMVVILASLLACQRHSPPPETTALEPYIPSPGAVGFDIFPLGGSDATQNWLAAYTDDGKSTKFRIEIGPATMTADKSGSISAGKGRFLPQADSDSESLPFLHSLKAALQAKRLPTNIEQAEALSFDYVVLGENQTRFPDDSFRATPRGNWTAMKISLAKSEVFLNLNPVAHKAEFAIKDPADGDIVLAELAKIL